MDRYGAERPFDTASERIGRRNRCLAPRVRMFLEALLEGYNAGRSSVRGSSISRGGATIWERGAGGGASAPNRRFCREICRLSIVGFALCLPDVATGKIHALMLSAST